MHCSVIGVVVFLSGIAAKLVRWTLHFNDSKRPPKKFEKIEPLKWCIRWCAEKEGQGKSGARLTSWQEGIPPLPPLGLADIIARGDTPSPSMVVHWKGGLLMSWQGGYPGLFYGLMSWKWVIPPPPLCDDWLHSHWLPTKVWEKWRERGCRHVEVWVKCSHG